MMSNLEQKKCMPCEGITAPLSKKDSEFLLDNLSDDWELSNNNQEIKRTFKFIDFLSAMSFVKKCGDVAENEGHHPDLNLHNYNKVTVTLSTHAISGLSENDFILATKIDNLN